jgi:hypothetical protein
MNGHWMEIVLLGRLNGFLMASDEAQGCPVSSVDHVFGWSGLIIGWSDIDQIGGAQ